MLDCGKLTYVNEYDYFDFTLDETETTVVYYFSNYLHVSKTTVAFQKISEKQRAHKQYLTSIFHHSSLKIQRSRFSFRSKPSADLTETVIIISPLTPIDFVPSWYPVYFYSAVSDFRCSARISPRTAVAVAGIWPTNPTDVR